MIYSVEKVGDKEPYKYIAHYNSGRKMEFIGESELPKTVKDFIATKDSRVTDTHNNKPWVILYK